jgi:hypothetical protein
MMTIDPERLAIDLSTPLNSIFFPLPTSIRRLTPRGSVGSRAHRAAPRHRLAPQHGPSNYGSPYALNEGACKAGPPAAKRLARPPD